MKSRAKERSGRRDAEAIGFECRKLKSSSALEYYRFVPDEVDEYAPALVAVHGIQRSIRKHAKSYATLASRLKRVLIAPHFSSTDYPNYQRLGRAGRGKRADHALHRALEEISELLPIDPQSSLLFGFSGGAQFVHRYLMAHPERVRAAVVASAGWYTFPDAQRDYPRGLRVDAELPGLRFHIDRLLEVPVLVTVGSEDTGRGDTLRKSPRLDRQQGSNRVERAQNWHGAMRSLAKERGLAPRVVLELLPDVNHSLKKSMQAGLGDLAADFLEEHSARSASSNPTTTLTTSTAETE